MADTTETALGIITDQVTGSNNNTWGDNLDQNWVRIVEKVTGSADISVTAANVTLSLTQNRAPYLNLSGTLTGDRSVIVVTTKNHWIVYNGCSGAYDLTVKTNAGTGIVVPQGQWRWLFCDGTNVIELKMFDRNEPFTGIYGGSLGGTADVATATISNFTSSAYAAGQMFALLATGTNTTNVTLNINSIGAAAVLDRAGNQLPAGTIVNGGLYLIAHDGTQFVLMSTVGAELAAGTVATAALADDAVTGAKIADAVFGVGLSFDGTNAGLDLDELNAETTIAVDDLLAMIDTSDTSASNKMTVANFLKVINALTQETTIDTDADFLMMYDADAGVVDKVTPDALNTMVAISTTAHGGGSSVSISLPTGYDSFRIVLKGMKCSTSAALFRCQTRRTGQGSVDSASNSYSWSVFGTDSSPTAHGTASASATLMELIHNSIGLNSGYGHGFFNGILDFFNVGGLGHIVGKSVQAIASTYSNPCRMENLGTMNNAGPYDLITFSLSSGVFSGGTIELYGIRAAR